MKNWRLLNKDCELGRTQLLDKTFYISLDKETLKPGCSKMNKRVKIKC